MRATFRALSTLRGASTTAHRFMSSSTASTSVSDARPSLEGQTPDLAVLQHATVEPTVLKPYVSSELQEEDFFGIEPLVKIDEMFEARLHYGHKIGTLNNNMKWALYGERLGVCIFDLDITRKFLIRALNFVAHVSSRGGIIMFVSTNRESMFHVEKLGEYSHCRKWLEGTLTNSAQLIGATVRLPDLVVFLSTKTSLNEQHPAIIEAAKMAIPSVGVVDSNCDPAYLTYLVPANDDTPQSVDYLLRLFKEAITRGKALRAKKKQTEF